MRSEERKRVERELISTISHELRTPIAAVQGFAETLRRGGLDDRQNRLEFVELIEKHARHLSSLVDGLVDHASKELERREGVRARRRTTRRRRSAR